MTILRFFKGSEGVQVIPESILEREKLISEVSVHGLPTRSCSVLITDDRSLVAERISAVSSTLLFHKLTKNIPISKALCFWTESWASGSMLSVLVCHLSFLVPWSSQHNALNCCSSKHSVHTVKSPHHYTLHLELRGGLTLYIHSNTTQEPSQVSGFGSSATFLV